MNTYTLQGSRMAGHIELQYTSGLLNCIKLEFKDELKEDKFKLLINEIALHEDKITQLEKLGFTITRQMATNEKVGLFCRFYELHKGLKYKVSAADSGKIKLIKLTDALLTAYFTSDNFLFKGKHSISNLVKYYNELLAEMATPAKSKHPDHFSKAYQDKLSQHDMQEYWAHLRALGLKPVRDRFENVKDWVKE
ncbi:MAG: hypothetical protein ACXVAY_01500 [Mucilaginibacter sp.]